MTSLPGDHQHMARVNLPEDQWHDFRALAIRKKSSVAAYLGHLVQKELRRAARVDWRREAREERKTQIAVEDEDQVGATWIPPWEI